MLRIHKGHPAFEEHREDFNCKVYFYDFAKKNWHLWHQNSCETYKEHRSVYPEDLYDKKNDSGLMTKPGQGILEVE